MTVDTTLLSPSFALRPVVPQAPIQTHALPPPPAPPLPGSLGKAFPPRNDRFIVSDTMGGFSIPATISVDEVTQRTGVTLGRATIGAEVSGVLDDHCRLCLTHDGKWVIRNLVNGAQTSKNGVDLGNTTVTLNSGDTVRIGSADFTVTIEPSHALRFTRVRTAQASQSPWGQRDPWGRGQPSAANPVATQGPSPWVQGAAAPKQTPAPAQEIYNGPPVIRDGVLWVGQATEIRFVHDSNATGTIRQVPKELGVFNLTIGRNILFSTLHYTLTRNDAGNFVVTDSGGRATLARATNRDLKSHALVLTPGEMLVIREENLGYVLR